MRQEVAGKPCSVIKPAAPAEESLQVERHLMGSWPLELFPIYGLRISLFMYVVHPGAVRRIAVCGHLNQCDLPEDVLLHNLFGFDITFLLSSLVAELEDYSAVPDSLRHLVCFVDSSCHTLFAVDMFSRGYSIDRHLGMPVIRGRNDDCIHIFALEQFLIMTVSLGPFQ